MARIILSNVMKSFGGIVVIPDVDLTIEDGEFVVILGPSGCGKSTLLRMMAGLEATSGGRIDIGGRDVTRLAPKDRGCAMVFQNYALYPHMSVRGNIGYGLKIGGMARAEREARIAQTADLLDLTPLLDRKPSQLSGGQRQRVAIGRALAREPEVFLFDEPLSNLDAKLRTNMRVELRKLHDRLGTTSVYVTHDQVEAMTLADRIVVIKDGIIEQIGTPSEIYHHPATHFVAGFIGSPQANLLSGTLDADGNVFRDETGTEFRFSTSLLTPSVPRDVVLGIRPEDIGIGRGNVVGKVEVVEELGSHRLLYCRCGGASLTVSDNGPTSPDPQSPVRLTLPEEKLHLFDARDGRLLS